MRVISGKYKGRVLTTVRDLSVRPATDRVKQTLFDMLTNRLELEGATVLDLFAGSGGLGIEALSRGAAKATFVESNREAAEHIEKNLRAIECAEETEVLEMEALDFVERGRSQYDLVFADPPYTFEGTATIPALVFGAKMVKPGGFLLIEHAPEMAFASADGYRVGPVKKFGRTFVTFFRPAPETKQILHPE